MQAFKWQQRSHPCLTQCWVTGHRFYFLIIKSRPLFIPRHSKINKCVFQNPLSKTRKLSMKLLHNQTTLQHISGFRLTSWQIVTVLLWYTHAHEVLVPCSIWDHMLLSRAEYLSFFILFVFCSLKACTVLFSAAINFMESWFHTLIRWFKYTASRLENSLFYLGPE